MKTLIKVVFLTALTVFMYPISDALAANPDNPISAEDSTKKPVGVSDKYLFEGDISREVLANYLSRSMTMMDLLTGKGNPEDNVRMMKNCGVKFAGRTIYLWGGESSLEGKIAAAKTIVPKVRKADKDIILQGCVFEIVTTQVSTLPIPDWVFEEFGLAAEKRTFNYKAMLFPDGRFVNHWRKGSSVPDMTQLETRMWFYYLAARYIDTGCEAIHFGQVALIGATDTGYAKWWDMLSRVRRYANKNARRGILLCDAHTPRGGPRLKDGRLLFDFHSFPLRIEEVADKPEEGILKMGHYDSIYGRSNGGITPSGWRCESLPYLVELDNFGRSGKEGQVSDNHWIWGYDEICWFARQSQSNRNQWLRYAWKWVRENDRNGFLQMPGSRCLAYPVIEKDGTKLNWYFVNTKSPATPDGFNQEETIREIWLKDSINQDEPLRVVVLTGGHNFDEKPFYEMFANFDNFEIDHIKINKECTYFDDISQWDHDVIVFYNFRNELSTEGSKNLLKLCNDGLGMVVLHHAIAGFPEWPMWNEIAGAHYFLDDTQLEDKLWKRCTYKHDVTFKVKVEKSNSVVTDGIEDFEIVDETYKGYRLVPGNQILLTADNPHSQKEIGWTRTFLKSRVCFIQPGHGKDAFKNRNYQQLLNQSIHWAGSVAVQPGNSKKLQKHHL